MKRLTEWMEQRSRSSYILMLMVGGYLLYMVYEMLGGLASLSTSRVPVYIFSVLFVIAGVLMLSIGIFAFAGGHYREVTAQDDMKKETDPTEDR